MRRLLTKADRLNSQAVQFEYLKKGGYIREDYKALVFWIKDEEQKDGNKVYLLKYFRGTASHHIDYRAYRTEERRAEAIQKAKENFDSLQEYKANRPNQKSSQANCAAAVKAELQKKFPGVKFSVKSESFAGGDSVQISWTNGPTEEQVNAIGKQYQYGNFNGMEDLYEYTNSRPDIPQAKYVQASRNISDDIKEKLLPFAEEIFKTGFYQGCYEPSNVLYRILYHTPLMPGCNPIGIILNTNNDYRHSHIVIFEEPETTNQPTKEPAKVIELSSVKVNKAGVMETPPAQPAGNIQVLKYSEKSFAVIGEGTKKIKDQLKAAGGSFNKFLTCGPGWIFSNKRLDEVKELLIGKTENK